MLAPPGARTLANRQLSCDARKCDCADSSNDFASRWAGLTAPLRRSILLLDETQSRCGVCDHPSGRGTLVPAEDTQCSQLVPPAVPTLTRPKRQVDLARMPVL